VTATAGRQPAVVAPAPPGSRRREDAADQRPGDEASGDREPVRGEHPAAVLALRRGRGQERQRRGRHRGSARALQRPARDHDHAAPGARSHGRSAGEDHEAGDEQPAPAERVGGPACREQQAAERQAVRAEQPANLARCEAELGAQMRGGDAHNGEVDREQHRRRAACDHGTAAHASPWVTTGPMWSRRPSSSVIRWPRPVSSGWIVYVMWPSAWSCSAAQIASTSRGSLSGAK
jgi:hypothetical protein